jgi:hypothetical protein
MPPLQTASKEETANAFLRLAQSLNPLTIVIYSDGSLSSEGAASYGFTIHQDNLSILDGLSRLGPAEAFDAEAIDAEATGALEPEGRPKPINISIPKHHHLPRQPRGRHMPTRRTV